MYINTLVKTKISVTEFFQILTQKKNNRSSCSDNRLKIVKTSLSKGHTNIKLKSIILVIIKMEDSVCNNKFNIRY